MKKGMFWTALAGCLLALNGCNLRKTNQEHKELAGWEVLGNLDKAYGNDYPSYVEGRYFDNRGTPVLQIRGDTLQARKELAQAAGSNNFRLEQVGNGGLFAKRTGQLVDRDAQTAGCNHRHSLTHQCLWQRSRGTQDKSRPVAQHCGVARTLPQGNHGFTGTGVRRA